MAQLTWPHQHASSSFERLLSGGKKEWTSLAYFHLGSHYSKTKTASWTEAENSTSPGIGPRPATTGCAEPFTSTSSGQGGVPWSWLDSDQGTSGERIWGLKRYTKWPSLITLLISGSVWTLPSHNQLLHLLSWLKPAPVLTSPSRLFLIHSPEVSLPSVQG